MMGENNERVRVLSSKRYGCNDCGKGFVKKRDNCPYCASENIYDTKEAPRADTISPARVADSVNSVIRRTVKVTDSVSEFARVPSGMPGFDRVLGGGVVPGSVCLLAGTPGAGKSTLLATVCQSLAGQGVNVLYVSGEESAKQVALRHRRLGVVSDRVDILSTQSLDDVVTCLASQRWGFVVVDSVQTIRGVDVSVAGVAELVCQYAHASGVPVVMVGHETKGAQVAGPQTLAHAVDVVLTLRHFGDEGLRILRQEKNRYGSTEESLILRHTDRAFVEVADPSGILFSREVGSVIGIGPTIILEGTKPVVGEVQCLVSEPLSPHAQFVASGINTQKARVIVASLSNVGLPVFGKDVYIEAGGGMSLRDSGADLAIAGCVVSSALGVGVPVKTVFIGEVLLTSELRRASQLELRLSEAKRLGCRTVGPGCEVDIRSVKDLIVFIRDL